MKFEKKELSPEEGERLKIRVRWAHVILEKAGFMQWGESEEHGFSRYYIPDGSELAYDAHVRIRVSDHYAHPIRTDDFGLASKDFGVDVSSDSSQQQIEEATRQAIKDRADYLLTDEFKAFVKERRVEEAKYTGIDPEEDE